MSADRSTDEMPSARSAETRLLDAAAKGDVVELVVVLRGRVRRRPGKLQGAWTVRLGDGRYRAFSPETVIAVTQVTKRRARSTGDAQSAPQSAALVPANAVASAAPLGAE